MKVAVAGTGYVGLSIATLLSQHHKVMAVDIVKEKVDLINNRKSPIQDDYIEKYLAEKELNLTATLDIFDDVKRISFEEGFEAGKISYISEEVYTAFVEAVKKESVLGDTQVNKDVAIVYSPLNGTGLKPVIRTLKESGYTNITVVKEQEQPDGTFPTCPYPNPEVRQAMELGIEYLPYTKGIYNAAEISLNAERCRTYKIRQEQVRLLKETPSEENLWQAVIAFQDYPFKTATGLPFRYKLKVGKNGEYNRELLIDRREKSKSLAWSSVVRAFENSKRISEEVKKPKALGDIRGVSYIYPILWRFGLIRVPEAIEKKMGKQR